MPSRCQSRSCAIFVMRPLVLWLALKMLQCVFVTCFRSQSVDRAELRVVLLPAHRFKMNHSVVERRTSGEKKTSDNPRCNRTSPTPSSWSGSLFKQTRLQVALGWHLPQEPPESAIMFCRTKVRTARILRVRLLFTDLHLVAWPPCSSTTMCSFWASGHPNRYGIFPSWLECSSSCGPSASDHLRYHSFANFNHFHGAVLAHMPRVWRLPIMLHKASINNHRSELDYRFHDLETGRDFDANSLFEANPSAPWFLPWSPGLHCSAAPFACVLYAGGFWRHCFVFPLVLHRFLDLNQCWLSITLDDELRLTPQPCVVTNHVDTPSVSCTFCFTNMGRNTPSGLVLHDDHLNLVIACSLSPNAL